MDTVPTAVMGELEPNNAAVRVQIMPPKEHPDEHRVSARYRDPMRNRLTE